MTQLKVEIFGVPQSNFTRAVRIACEEKSIPYDHRPVAPHSPEVNAIHPLGKIPVLRYGDLTLAESWPIVSYLDKAFPESPMVLGETPESAAEVDQWVSIVATSVDPILVRKYVFAHLFPDTPDGSVDQVAVEATLPKMKAILAMLEARLAGRSFVAADRFTFADALLLSTLAPLERLPESARAIKASPNIASYLARHATRPSLMATNPWS
ncbi:glutathione S-transferase family protein [Phenylobacterium sp.]|jgi:glutathione S-transferase|uniref:glutathione S-transferase family protein n=1 Tax=Phenylobacterium sp. TaxID=1871053 RepID=UPI002E33D12B|nr:glutathione S-transferase family protein [Phenylobacterium sp.]HEX4710616.1 glutathione S-transferase family protein [Phenylobacterium sp.]